MTKEQAEALAALLHVLRPEWDVSGIMAALRMAWKRGDAFAIARVAVAAAADKGNRTPAVIGLDGPLWGRSAAIREHPTSRDETCSTCGQPEPVCKARWNGEHNFMSVAQAKARAIRDAERNKPKRPARIEELDGRMINDVELPA